MDVDTVCMNCDESEGIPPTRLCIVTIYGGLKLHSEISTFLGMVHGVFWRHIIAS